MGDMKGDNFGTKEVLTGREGCRNSHGVLASIGVYNIGCPLLAGSINETRGIDLGPNCALTVKGVSGRGGFSNIHLDRPLVATRDSVFASSLVMLVPFKGDLPDTDKLNDSLEWII